MKQEDLLNQLVSLGFSVIEAKIYYTLIPQNGLSGYQIAKVLQIARSSIYPALDSLCAKGYVQLIPGNPNLYKATDPELLFSSLSDNYIKTATLTKQELIKLTGEKTTEERYLNICGKANLITKAIELINSAQKEIVMNSTMNLTPFISALKEATKRGVRIILFSWRNLDTEDISLEFYCAWDGRDFCADQRLLIVTDASCCIAGSNDRGNYIPHKPITESKKLPAEDENFIGMTSSNSLIVSLILEHIHFDIYMLRLRSKNGGDVVTKDIQIGSLMETGF